MHPSITQLFTAIQHFIWSIQTNYLELKDFANFATFWRWEQHWNHCLQVHAQVPKTPRDPGLQHADLKQMSALSSLHAHAGKTSFIPSEEPQKGISQHFASYIYAMQSAWYFISGVCQENGCMHCAQYRSPGLRMSHRHKSVIYICFPHPYRFLVN